MPHPEHSLPLSWPWLRFENPEEQPFYFKLNSDAERHGENLTDADVKAGWTIRESGSHLDCFVYENNLTHDRHYEDGAVSKARLDKRCARHYSLFAYDTCPPYYMKLGNRFTRHAKILTDEDRAAGWVYDAASAKYVNERLRERHNDIDMANEVRREKARALRDEAKGKAATGKSEAAVEKRTAGLARKTAAYHRLCTRTHSTANQKQSERNLRGMSDASMVLRTRHSERATPPAKRKSASVTERSSPNYGELCWTGQMTAQLQGTFSAAWKKMIGRGQINGRQKEERKGRRKHATNPGPPCRSVLHSYNAYMQRCVAATTLACARL